MENILGFGKSSVYAFLNDYCALALVPVLIIHVERSIFWQMINF